MRYARTDHDCETTLSIEGVLDTEGAAELRPVFATLEASPQLLVTLDLASLERMDMMGLAALAALHRRMREVGTALRVEGLSGQPLTLIRALSLARYFAPEEVDAPARPAADGAFHAAASSTHRTEPLDSRTVT